MDRQFFKPSPRATSFDDFTPLPPVPVQPPPQHPHPHPPPPRPDGIPDVLFDGMPFEDMVYINRTPPPPPSTKPTKFSRVPPMKHLPLFIGGVQSAPKGATPPPTGGILDKLSSSMDGMMIPILIGGGVLLIILIS